MNVWKDVELSAIYTLSPTHCGVGQAAGAVDLPIAREAQTGFPVIPATSLKGSLRDYIERSELPKKIIDKLFGKSLEDAEEAETAEAGGLAFTEARLLAIPIRCLSAPYMHVTCPLILERFRRDLRAIGLLGFLDWDWRVSDLKKGQVHVADGSLQGVSLVLEDLVYEADQVGYLPMVENLANALTGLLPEEEQDSRNRLKKGLAVVPDEDFNDLVSRAVPVRARIRLTGGKTADQWFNPDTNEIEKGNLWYEEVLPSDCLFASFVGERRQIKQFRENSSPGSETLGPLAIFRKNSDSVKVIQVGGNETVGHGLCFFSLWSKNGGKNES